MSDPTFLLIGAQKCGTTWLARMLAEHPDVFTAPTKELHFFSVRENYARGLDWYRAQFAGASGETAIGECTPNYLWICQNEDEIRTRGVVADVAPLVREHYPDVRLIVALRNPLDRARSAYFHFARSGAFRPGRSILEVGHENGIITMGEYRSQIERWLELFDRDQMLFLIYEEDIGSKKESTLERVYQFLGVDPGYKSDAMSEHYNVRSGDLYIRMKYAAPRVTYKLSTIAPWLITSNLARIKIPDSDLAELAKHYEVANAGLDDLIGRPIPW